MRYTRLVGLLLLCGLLLALAPAVRAQTATSTVTSLTDAATTTPGTLRYLLNRANATSTPTAIIFNSALSGGTLTPASPLPLSANIRLLAQDADGMAVDITLDGSQLPTDSERPLAQRSVLTISSPTATVSGFDIVNFAGAGIFVSASSNCPANARVTISDNVLVATSSASGIHMGDSAGCAAVTIRENDISQTPGSRVNGIYMQKTLRSMATSSVDLIVSDNTITTNSTGIYLGHTLQSMASSSVAALVSDNTITGEGQGIILANVIGGGSSNRVDVGLSANHITGASTGINITELLDSNSSNRVDARLSANHITGADNGIEMSTTALNGSSAETDTTLSANRITGASRGIRIMLDGSGGSGRNTVSGSNNTVISSVMDISASEDTYEVNGRLENTIFNTKRLTVGTRTNSFTVHRYQVDRLPPGGITGGHRTQAGTTEIVTVTTIEETYLADPAQFTPREAVERAVSVVSGQATSTDFGTIPVVASLIPRDADGRVASLGLTQPVRVCLPVPADLSASNPRLAWRDGPVWRTLPSARSGGQICADFRGFPLFNIPPPMATSTVTNLTDNANTLGSLRYLLNRANATSTPTAIIFDPALNGGTITPASPLPLAGNTRLLAQDADGMTVDITLDGSQLPTDSERPLAQRSVLTIASPTATVQGFDIVNFASAGIAVASSSNCPINARVTISDNVLVASSTATSTARAIELDSGPGCAAVTIRENDISQTPGSRATGIYLHKTLSGTATSSVDLLVSDNTITTSLNGVYLRTSLSNMATSSLAATLSANRITGASRGLDITSTTSAGTNSQVAATLSRNYITRAGFGIWMSLDGSGGSNTVTVDGTSNVIIDSSTLDIYASEYGRNGSQVGRSGFDVSGRLEHTIFNSRNRAAGELPSRFTHHVYRIAVRPPNFPPPWVHYWFPDSFTVHRYQAATFLRGSGILDQEFLPFFTPNQVVDNQRAFSLVSSPTTPPDFGTMPVTVKLIPDNIALIVGTRPILGVTHPIRVCLPLPADLSDAPNPRIAWWEGARSWRALSSERSGSQICTDFSLSRLPSLLPFTATSTVTTLTDDASTAGSLRHLLNRANATSTPTAIIFDPALNGGTITPASPLPLAGNTRLLAQDADGRPVDITLDGSSTGNAVLRISSPTATVQGFDIVNFASAGIAVAASSSCPINARVTISDNVLVASSTATSTARAIELDSGPGCAAVTIRENAISQTPGSRATGIYLHKTLSGTATSSVDLLVSDNTITTSLNGVYLRTSLSNTARSSLATTLSANRITGASRGIDITSTTSAGTSSQVAATLSRNYITRADFGMRIDLDGSGGSNTVTVDGTSNVIIGSSVMDIFASESTYEVNGRLEHTIFNTANLSGVRERANSFTAHRYQVDRLPPGGITGGHRTQAGTTEIVTVTTIEETYLADPAQLVPREAVERAVSVVSGQATSTDFGTMPVVAGLLPQAADGRVASLGLTQPVRVCLPVPADLSASNPRLAWRDGPVWRTLPSARSGGQICADFRGFPLFNISPPMATSTVTNLTDNANTLGSLRYLLNRANATSTPTAIIFDPALNGGTITPASPLPLAGNTRLLAQDADGMTVDITLDGSQLPTDSERPLAQRSVLTIASPTATVQGFDIVNFASAGIAVASSSNCPINARVTISDNVLVASSTATSTPHAIEVTSVTNQCAAVTIRANDISQTPGSRATGIAIRSTDAGTRHTMASSSVDAIVSDNTITTDVGISIARSTTIGGNSSRVTARLSANHITGTREGIALVSTLGSGRSNSLVAQLSDNRITGPQDGIAVLGSAGHGALDRAAVTLSGNRLTGTQKGIRIANTTFGSGTSLSTDATLSGNYIAGARRGIEIDLSGSGTSNRATVNGTGNVVLGSSDTDISASENRYQINGRLEHTIFNTKRLTVGTRANSFTVHRYQAVTFLGASSTTLAQEYQQTFTPSQVGANQRAFSVVSSPTPPPDFGAMPVAVKLIPANPDGTVVSLGVTHPVRVCLPVLADLSDAPDPRITWRDGAAWRALSSARSGGQICAEFSLSQLPSLLPFTATSIVTTLTDDANMAGSLRYLLNRANATSTPTTILFDPTLNGGTITPTSPLPLAGNTRLLAQDADGMAVDITLDGAQLPAVLRIASPTATVQGFDIVNFASAGIAVAASSNCPVTARVTLSDNVLVASSTARAIELDSGPGCTAVTIRENAISQTPGSRATGIYLHKTLSGTATSSVDLLVSDNTITTSATGVYLRTSLSNTATSSLATTLSANRITGASRGLDITSTTSADTSSQVAATLSRNYITGASFGIWMRLDGSGGSNTVTVDGSWNTVLGSSTLDLYASEYGFNGSQVGRSGFAVSGRLEHTIFNTRNVIPGEPPEPHTPFTLNAYNAAQRQRPPAVWALYHWPASLTAHRYQAATFLGASTTTLVEEYQQTFTPSQVGANQRAFSVVSSPTPPPDFGAMPVAVKLIPANPDGDMVTLGVTHPVRVCLPVLADLSDAPDPRITWRDGAAWRALSSARSDGQICAEFSLSQLPSLLPFTATSIVTTLTDDANTPGSLRYLLNRANATSTPTTILFDPTLSGGTITPTSPLPLAGNTRLLAQDADGMAVDITLDGAQLPAVLRIASPTATVQGFDIVNFAEVGIAVAASSNCPVTARVTLSDNVLVASSTARAIELDSSPGCTAVTISENDISQTPGSRATGIYLHKTLSGTATSSVDLLVSDNTISTSATGVYLRTSLSNTATSSLATTLSANRITGASRGLDITSTTSADTSSQVAATLSRNYITGASFGIWMRLDGSGGSNTVTVDGSWNTVLGSSTLDLYASEYGRNGSQVGRSGFAVSGRLEHTIFNTQNIKPDANAVGRDKRLILAAYRAALRQRPAPAAWALYHWPASLTAHRYQAATLAQGGTGITPDEEYASALTQSHENARSFSVVASQTTPLDFGGPPVFLNLLFRNAAGNIVTLGDTQAVRVCLPVPADLSDAPAPRIAGRAGASWRALPSEPPSGGQICTNIFGFSDFTLAGALEEPVEGSSQSGTGLISGWTCSGVITLEVDGNPIGTTTPTISRVDVAAAGQCGGREANVGFEYSVDWNEFGAGSHTIRALADGVEFGRATFTVTAPIETPPTETLPTETPTETPPTDTGGGGSGGGSPVTPPPLAGVLENPGEGSFLSGTGRISGWTCSQGVITLEVDGTSIGTATRTSRADVAAAGQCEGRADVGFERQVDWNGFGAGLHTIRALADGVEFGRATFTVTVLVGVLENPEPDSFLSGIGLISGWTCARGAIEVEVEVDGTTYRLRAASGTGRGDVAAAGVCGGRGDVGFGLLFNWNLLRDGRHTIRVLADGVELSRTTFTVTTLGEEYVRGASGETFVDNFPSPGQQARLVWQEGSQNFMLAPLSAPAPPPAASSPTAGPLGALETPADGSFQSGISVIRGWVCEAEMVELEINAIHRLAAASGTGRADTAEACGNDGNNGFGLLFNWNLLGDGAHTIRALADGVEFSRATFTVTTLGGEAFVRGASRQVVVADFPSAGETVTLVWQQSSQNFVITNLE